MNIGGFFSSIVLFYFLSDEAFDDKNNYCPVHSIIILIISGSSEPSVFFLAGVGKSHPLDKIT
jgi:hypothetical protein